jgi:hypothetical protein
LVLLAVPAWADVSWWLAPYVRADEFGRHIRACKIVQYWPQIQADGGTFREVEVLGNHCLVKVRSSAATIQLLADDADFRRLPKDALSMPLSDLNNQQKTRLRNVVLSLGYTTQELQERFPNDLSTYTLGDVARFIASRRLKPRYDQATDTIIVDGPVQPTGSVDAIEEAVK